MNTLFCVVASPGPTAGLARRLVRPPVPGSLIPGYSFKFVMYFSSEDDSNAIIDYDCSLADHLAVQGLDPASVTPRLQASFCHCAELQFDPKHDQEPKSFATDFSEEEAKQEVFMTSFIEMVIRAHIMAHGFGCEELLLHQLRH